MLNSEWIKMSNGEYIKVRKGMFHTYIETESGEEIQLDADYEDVLKLLEK